MPTRNINLTDHYDALVSRLLDSGKFRNASEIVRAGLRLLEYQDLEERAKLEALRDAFKEGQDAYARGDFVAMGNDAEIDRFFDEMDAEIERAS